MFYSALLISTAETLLRSAAETRKREVAAAVTCSVPMADRGRGDRPFGDPLS